LDFQQNQSAQNLKITITRLFDDAFMLLHRMNKSGFIGPVLVTPAKATLQGPKHVESNDHSGISEAKVLYLQWN